MSVTNARLIVEGIGGWGGDIPHNWRNGCIPTSNYARFVFSRLRHLPGNHPCCKMRMMSETSETFARLQKIFQDVFLDDGLTISAETNSNDFEGWDSLTHVTLMVHVERVFDIQFTSSEIASWKNVGELEQLIEARVRQKG